ncbi:MAG: hypothetical protein LBI63_04990 [Candidatus Ancillula sp.]|nr:hypothetical protein [Candidatus Ancillula sp.]
MRQEKLNKKDVRDFYKIFNGMSPIQGLFLFLMALVYKLLYCAGFVIILFWIFGDKTLIRISIGLGSIIAGYIFYKITRKHVLKIIDSNPFVRHNQQMYPAELKTYIRSRFHDVKRVTVANVMIDEALRAQVESLHNIGVMRTYDALMLLSENGYLYLWLCDITRRYAGYHGYGLGKRSIPSLHELVEDFEGFCLDCRTKIELDNQLGSKDFQEFLLECVMESRNVKKRVALKDIYVGYCERSWVRIEEEN